MKFNIGDKVKWGSESGGFFKIKRGIIIAIIPPKKSPKALLPEAFKCNSFAGYGGSRKHESYLIQVGESKRLYWPRVKNLFLLGPVIRIYTIPKFK